jgi:hypothetical protein
MLRIRRVLPGLAAAVVIMACGGDGPTSGGARIPRALLSGDYTCVQFEGVFVGPKGLGQYEGTCEAYANVSNPSRRDSSELAPFTIGEDNSISRQEFSAATLVYDSTTAVLIVTDAEQNVEHYQAVLQNGVVYLVREFEPFDFSGDGLDDELVLIYRRR